MYLTMKTIKIFVASSEELKPERKEMADMVVDMNYALNKMDMNIVLHMWEYLDASMGVEHKQAEYNRKLQECEICLVLYWTKFGKYTKSELDTAYNSLKEGKNPRKLYVYFKDSDRELTPELKTFRDSFPTEYGQFPCVFHNEDELRVYFLLQFIDYQNALLKDSLLIVVKDAKVMVGGQQFADLTNVNFLGKNEEYAQLVKSIQKICKSASTTSSSTIPNQ